jgi:hypothetical protein
MLRVAGLGGRPIGYYIFHRVNEMKHRFSRKARARRMQDFRRLMKIKGGERIIDLGGTPQFWEDIDTPLELTILNLPGYNPAYDGSSHHKITLLEGDACEVEFADKSFDIAFSNSVIEHVGGADNEDRLALEARRLAPAYWVQTPSIWFPIEAHNNMPLWWFYPPFVKRAFMRRWRQRLPAWAEMIDGTVVISKSRMLKMFPDSELMVERALGFVKSYTCFKRPRA